jgi:hypothetical protein
MKSSSNHNMDPKGQIGRRLVAIANVFSLKIRVLGVSVSGGDWRGLNDALPREKECILQPASALW